MDAQTVISQRIKLQLGDALVNFIIAQASLEAATHENAAKDEKIAELEARVKELEPPKEPEPAAAK